MSLEYTCPRCFRLNKLDESTTWFDISRNISWYGCTCGSSYVSIYIDKELKEVQSYLFDLHGTNNDGDVWSIEGDKNKTILYFKIDNWLMNSDAIEIKKLIPLDISLSIAENLENIITKLKKYQHFR